MVELVDIYNDKRERTGRVVDRHDPSHVVGEGERKLVVHIWIKNSKGEFLLQKRAMCKSSHPGKWHVTGGSVTSGENSEQGFLRELEEELSIVPRQGAYSFIGYDTGWSGRYFTDQWLVKDDIDITALKLQEEEVDSVAWYTPDQIDELIKERGCPGGLVSTWTKWRNALIEA